MFYHPNTGREFAHLTSFYQAFPNTSFGDLSTEVARNAVGLFTIEEGPPTYNPITHRLNPLGVIRRNGLWARDWSVTQKAVDAIRADLISAVADKRWRCETGGLTVGGVRVLTAIDDQNRITSIIANAQLAGVLSVDFKASSGWVTLTLAQLQGIAGAIALHVQACFKAERAHYDAIQTATEADLLTYDINAGWPV